MLRLTKGIARLSRALNTLAGAAIVAMMLLTCADVVFRLLRQPIPGTYEMVGFLGTIVASFALAYTSLEKGHIAVEILVERFPRRLQTLIESAASLAGGALFSLLGWQSALYASELRHSGEVSVTLTMPIYPFIYGIALGSGLLALLLLVESLRSLVRAVRA
jgi:TRAP-type C4-dicarboxylate transport system permease small subunit